MSKIWKKFRMPIISALILAVLLAGLFGVPQIHSTSQNGIPVIGIGQNTITIGNEAYAAGVADYVCDGVQDNVQFFAAINALPAGGGELVVLAGTYNFSATVTRAINNITITGTGQGTYFTYNGVNPIFTAGGNNWKIQGVRTDAGGINMGATTGWLWINVNNGATAYDFRTPSGSIVDGVYTGTSFVGGTFSGTSVTDSGLTAGRVPIAGVGGLLGDNVNLTYDGSADTDAATLNKLGDLSASAWVVANDAPATIKAYATTLQAAGYPAWVCDGTADDVEINAAIAAVPASGGEVRLSEGTFSLKAAINPKSETGLSIRGIPGATTFTLAFPFTGSTQGFAIELELCTGCTIADFKLNLADDQTIPSISIYQSPSTTISNVEIYGDGIDGGNQGFVIYQSEYSYFRDCYVHDIGEATDAISQASGYDCKGTSHVTFENCRVSDLVDGARGGWEIEDGNTDLKLINCSSWDNAGNGYEAHIHTADQNRIWLINCDAWDNDGCGVFMQGGVGGTSSDFIVDGGNYVGNLATAIKFVNIDRTVVQNAYIETDSTLNDWALSGVGRIENNTFKLYTNVGFYGLTQTGAEGIITGNYIYGTSLAYRNIYYGSGAVISHNYLESGGIEPTGATSDVVITGNTLDAGDISLAAATRARCTSNTVGGYISLKQATQCRVEDNTVGVASDDFAFTWGNSTGSYNSILRNTVKAVDFGVSEGTGNGYNTWGNNDFTAATVRAFYASPLKTDRVYDNFGYDTLLASQSGIFSVVDDGQLILPDASTGWGFAQIGDNEEYALFSWTTAGAVTLISNSVNTVNTDTDDKFCIYDAGTDVRIKNRLGAEKIVRWAIYYS
jgi:hypothetical protein